MGGGGAPPPLKANLLVTQANSCTCTAPGPILATQGGTQVAYRYLSRYGKIENIKNAPNHQPVYLMCVFFGTRDDYGIVLKAGPHVPKMMVEGIEVFRHLTLISCLAKRNVAGFKDNREKTSF